MALHGTQRRFDNGPAGVLVLFAGRNVRLDANHTFALYLGFTAVAVGDKPVAPQQLHGRASQIADGHRIGENIALFIRCRLRFDIDTLYVNTYPGRIDHGLTLLRRRVIRQVVCQLAVLGDRDVLCPHRRVNT